MSSDAQQRESKAFSAVVEGTVLTITIHREFDSGGLHQDWAHSIVTTHAGGFSEVRLDMSRCGRVSSTFYAGLMHLHFAYTGKGAKPLVLIRPDARMLANLRILHFDQYFVIE